MTDLRYAIRQFKRQPGFTVVAVLTLALGIGGSTAVFSLVKGIVLAPLPYEAPSELVVLSQAHPEKSINEAPVSLPNLQDWSSSNTVMDGIAAWPIFDFRGLVLTGVGEPKELRTGYVSGDFFRVLRVQAELGRVFTGAEDVDGANAVVVLSHRMWQQRFGSDSGLIGRPIVLDERPFTVLGIAPRHLRLPHADTEIWTPLSVIDTTRIPHQVRSLRWLVAIARLAQAVTIDQATAGMSAVATQLASAYPDQNAGWTAVAVRPLHDALVGNTSTALWILFGAMGLVLVVSCTNVASLMLARGTARKRELAVRSALGSSVRRLIRQLLVESLVLSAVGGVVGAVGALWGMDVILGVAGDRLPRALEVGIDGWALAFAAAVSVLTGLAFGTLPAFFAVRRTPYSALQEGARSSGGKRLQWVRGALVASELALTVTLVSGAGLLINSLARLYATDPGFAADGVHALEFVIPEAYYDSREEYLGFYEAVLARVRAVPGVASVGGTNLLPGRGSGEGVEFSVPGVESPSDDGFEALWRAVSPGYFETMRIPVLGGRTFDQTDRADAAAVAVISQSLANQIWGDRGGVGRFVDLGEPVQVVGIVDDVKHRGLRLPAEPVLYRPVHQQPRRVLGLVVRSVLPPSVVTASVREAIWELNPNQPFTRVSSMPEVMSQTVTQTRFVTLLLGAFAAIAMALAAIGVYGVVSYTVNQRSREIGIRMAFGARASDVVRWVVGRALRFSAIGVVVGVAGALFVNRLLESQLFGVTASDPLTFLAVVGVLLVVATTAAVLPALRATYVDPVCTLREE